MNLEEKLYTSTEVAQILGVSLRSVYRYMEESKLNAEVKTATGRHRFTKKNILDFLYPNTSQDTKMESTRAEVGTTGQIKHTGANVTSRVEVKRAPIEQKKPEPVLQPESEPDIEPEAPIDWLAKFREAAAKFKTTEPVEEMQAEPRKASRSESTILSESQIAQVRIQDKNEDLSEEQGIYYYRSTIGGLKDIAQNIDRGARRSFVDYAFTMNAGLSLHKPIKPFSVLHAYVHLEDREFFERILNLVPSDEKDAQLSLLVSDNESIFRNKKEMHGLYVVSDSQLRTDLLNSGEIDLASELK